MVRLSFFVSAVFLASVFLTLVTAKPDYPTKIPNGQNPSLPCMELGHINCAAGGPRNQFGLDFAANAYTWDETLCMMDSDGDGLTNGEELGDPCCQWTGAGDDGMLRTDNISHPGNDTSTEAMGQEGCTQGGANMAAPAAAATTAAATAAAATEGPNAAPGAPEASMMPGGDAQGLMTASPVPTGVAQGMTGENPLMTASPVPTDAAGVTTGVPNFPAAESGAPAGPAGTDGPFDNEADASLTPSPEGSSLLDAAACFPAEATVMIKGGSKVAMKDLKVGDEVLAKMPNTYSSVYMFSHKEQNSVNDFVRVSTSNGHVITASPGHYIIVNGKMKAAGSIVGGDKLMTESGEDKVVGVENVRKQGLYNPHTVAGSIVVDGVLASDVTTAVKPSVARTLLAPFKLMYRLFQRDLSGGVLNNGWASLARLAPVGAKEL